MVIETQEPGVRIIDKTGPLANPADRDHCIQYMVAIPLLFGTARRAADYEDSIANDPRVDALRAKMQVKENPTFTKEYYDAAQALHRQCGAGVLQGRHAPARVCRWTFRSAIASAAPRACRCWSRNSRPASRRISAAKQTESIKAMFADRAALAAMPVSEFVARLVTAS